ncbi:PEP-CTERM sorting domain-containing protein [Colwellia sp. MSW7]|jgi:hypothetical protein|uniref:PEP-CTERM sorting domain-containing protein n=1 Tax=Colwellia maritima TaxID=2912588 RepID=A0ABS9WZM1_9GAMM|nr:PEP-CTERM sorting domain-containing protein [Colwellia maritima]MCI2283418.1 PEP-CTERM sorting domain-containing protein [Colwellia maritima]
MSSKLLNAVLTCLLTLCLMGKANAGLLVVGDLYEDSIQSGLYWEYVGSFDLTNEFDPAGSKKSYNGIEAALLFFPGLTANDIALSTNEESDYADIANFLVNHQAFYDTYEGGALGVDGIVEKLEDISPTDVNGNSNYDYSGDISANVHDRAATRSDIAFLESLGQTDLPPLYVNHVFKAVTTSVPEPSTLAIFALALVGLASRRLKR